MGIQNALSTDTGGSFALGKAPKQTVNIHYVAAEQISGNYITVVLQDRRAG